MSFIAGLLIGAVVMASLCAASDSDDDAYKQMRGEDVESLIQKSYLDGYSAGKRG